VLREARAFILSASDTALALCVKKKGVQSKKASQCFFMLCPYKILGAAQVNLEIR